MKWRGKGKNCGRREGSDTRYQNQDQKEEGISLKKEREMEHVGESRQASRKLMKRRLQDGRTGDQIKTQRREFKKI